MGSFNKPIAIDLFSGCGGLSLGLQAAGFEIAAAVEIDPIHAAVHHRNFPQTRIFCEDIRQLAPGKLRQALGDRELDLIAGGPPCQGYSMIGKRSLDDPRNQLVFVFAEFIRELQPKYFLFENVPGLACGKHAAFLEELLQLWQSYDYQIVEPVQILDAADYQAPQKRKRLIVMGARSDCPLPQYPAPSARQVTVSQAIGDLSEIPVYIKQDLGLPRSALDYSGYRTFYDALTWGSLERSEPPSLIFGHLGSTHTAVTQARFAATAPGSKEPISRFHKLDPDGLAPTQRAGTDSKRGAFTAPRPIHYEQPRCLSIREIARLHTYPDWFVLHPTIFHGCREIGNSVVPRFAQALGQKILLFYS